MTLSSQVPLRQTFNQSESTILIEHSVALGARKNRPTLELRMGGGFRTSAEGR